MLRSPWHFALLAALAILGTFLIAPAAQAQALEDGSAQLSGLLELIQTNAGNWGDTLRGYATRLFWMLALIQFIWTFFPLVFRQAELGEIVGELIRFILIIGFFAALLEYSTEWASAVVDSFRQAGAAAAGLAGPGLRPGDMFGLAVELADTVGSAETWNPLAATMIALAGIVVLICFAFIAAFMALTIVESYVVINASVLFMGLGASQWTREYAIAMLRYALSVGAKLFILTLIVGLIVSSAREWQAAYNHDSASMWTMVGLSLVCAYLAKTIPDLIQGLITGTSYSGGGALGGMAAAGVAGAAAATAAIATAATAGAAAPAAAGALGAAGTGAAGGAGAGGLGASISSSLAAGQASGASTGAAGLGAAGSTAGAGTGAGAGGKAASAAMPRIAGGGSATPTSGAAGSTGSAPSMTGGQPKPAAAGSQGSSPATAAQAGNQGSAKPAGQAQPGQPDAARLADTGSAEPTAQAQPGQPDDARQADTGSAEPATQAQPDQSDDPHQADTGAASTSAAPGDEDSSSGGGIGRMVAASAVRGSGVLSAISVPGMEGAAGISLGPDAGGGGVPENGDQGAREFEVQGSDNIIQPSTTAAPTAPVPDVSTGSGQTVPPPTAPAAASPRIDSLSSLQQALKDRGSMS